MLVPDTRLGIGHPVAEHHKAGHCRLTGDILSVQKHRQRYDDLGAAVRPMSAHADHRRGVRGR
jgi:hypothetical protein